MQKRDLIQANASLENLRQNLDMKDIAKEILLEENYNKFIRSYKFQFVRISGYLWQNCGPGMPGPYRVTMRKPDMALRAAYMRPLQIGGRFTTRNVGGGVLDAPRRGQDFSLRMNRERDAAVSRGSRFSRA